MPGENIHNISVNAGDTVSRVFRLKAEDGSPIDLTGSTVVFRAAWSGGSLRLSSASSDQMLIPTPANGEVNFFLSEANTNAMPPGKPVRYVVKRRIGSEVVTVIRGDITVVSWVDDND